MNIKEIESRSGLPRSGIRYYESEGFLSPERSPNGYRDYSEADLQTLLKIKRLRALGLSLSEIRAVQSGASSLGDVLRAALARLGEQRGDLAGAEGLCRGLLESGADWDSLLEAPESAYSAPEPRSQVDIKYQSRAARRPGVPDWCDGLSSPGPWRRFGARWLDFVIINALVCAFNVLVLRINPFRESWENTLLSWLLSSALLLLGEPLWLHFCGTTPGKYIFGISVRAWDGGRLSVRDAFSRTGRVFLLGLGLNISVFELIALALAYRRELRDLDQPWDAEYGRWLLVCAPRGSGKTAAAAVGAAASLLLILFSLLSGDMPPNRGEITAAEFAENYNALAAYEGVGEYERMTTDGLLEEIPSNVTVINPSDGGTLPRFSFTEDGGVLTRVEFSAVRNEDGEGHVDDYGTYMSLTAMSYIWGRPGMGALSFSARQELLRTIEENSCRSFSAEFAGVEMSCEFEYSGYNKTDFGLWPIDGEEQSFSLRFTLEDTADS